VPRERARPSVRPTSRGWQAILAGGAVLGLAVAFGTTQLFQLAYVLFALLLVGLFAGLVGGGGFRYRREMPPEGGIVAGRPVRFGIVVLGARRYGGPVVEVRDRLPERRSLGWEGGGALDVEVTFSRRGVYSLGPAEVVSEDPYGMFRFDWRFAAREEVVVYPRVWPVPAELLEGDEGGGPERRTSRGEEFAGLREYRPGDELRHVSWKSLARTGELYVREFSDLAPARYTVALDLRRRGLRVTGREVEDAVSAAASVAAALREAGSPFRLVCNDGGVASTSFDASYEQHMRLLATVEADGSEPISDVLAAGRRDAGDGIVVVSRTRDEGLAACVNRLRASGTYVAVVALAPHAYPRSGGVRALDRVEEFEAWLASLEAAGAVVFVLRREEGAPGFYRVGRRRVGG